MLNTTSLLKKSFIITLNFVICALLVMATSAFANTDTQRPRVTLSASEQFLPGRGPAFVDAPFTATITFDEDVIGFDVSHFRITGEVGAGSATLSDFTLITPNRVWTVLVTPQVTLGSLEVYHAAVKDSAGNPSYASNSLGFSYDPGPPSVRIETSAPAFSNVDGKVNVLITFSQAIRTLPNSRGFLVSHINVDHGTVGNFEIIDASRYRATITADGSGNPVTIRIPAGSVENILRAKNTAANPVTLTIDPNTVPNTDQPTLKIIAVPPASGVPPGATVPITAGVATGVTTDYDQTIVLFKIAFIFSEPVFDFDVSDIAVRGATIDYFTSLDLTTYHLNILPSGNYDIELSVAEGAAKNLAGHGNKPARAITKSRYSGSFSVIADFISARANHILINQPNMTGFITGDNNNGGGPLGDLRLNSDLNNQTTMSFYTSRSKILAAQDVLAFADGKEGGEARSSNRAGTWDIWTQIQGSQSENQQRKAKLWTAGFGSHYFLEQDMLIGLMGQFDWASETNSSVNSKVTGTGFMVGPYISGKIKDQALYYEAHGLWGQSDNKTNPTGTYEDKFKTNRLLGSVKLEGLHDLGAFDIGGIHTDNIKLRPSVSLSYFQEIQKSYTDSNSLVIPEQTVSMGEFRFGPSLTRSFDLADEMGEGYTLKTDLGVSGIFNFGVENYAISNSPSISHALSNNQLRARIDGGVEIKNSDGINFTIAGFYDGVGVKNYSSYGGKLGILLPLN